jgi:hypothetical protein
MQYFQFFYLREQAVDEKQVSAMMQLRRINPHVRKQLISKQNQLRTHDICNDIQLFLIETESSRSQSLEIESF